MRRRNQAFVVVALVVAALATGCTTGESYAAAGYNFAALDKVAVVEVQLPIGGEAARDQIADVFAMELLKKGYQAVERRQVSAILKEQQFQAGDLTAPEDAARAGRILNIPAVIVVNIPTWGDKIDMTAKMIDVETGAIIWLGSGKGGTGKGMRTALGVAIVTGMRTDPALVSRTAFANARLLTRTGSVTSSGTLNVQRHES